MLHNCQLKFIQYFISKSLDKLNCHFSLSKEKIKMKEYFHKTCNLVTLSGNKSFLVIYEPWMDDEM